MLRMSIFNKSLKIITIAGVTILVSCYMSSLYNSVGYHVPLDKIYGCLILKTWCDLKTGCNGSCHNTGRLDDTLFWTRYIRWCFLLLNLNGNPASYLLEIRYFHVHGRNNGGNKTPHLMSLCVWSLWSKNCISWPENISNSIILFYLRIWYVLSRVT